MRLRKKALLLAYGLQKISSNSAKWIAGDAIRELTDSKTISSIKKRTSDSL